MSDGLDHSEMLFGSLALARGLLAGPVSPGPLIGSSLAGFSASYVEVCCSPFWVLVFKYVSPFTPYSVPYGGTFMFLLKEHLLFFAGDFSVDS